MPRRVILLRVLFASLALAAFFGAVGILFGSSTAVWRTASTSIFTAIASMLLLAASGKMDSPQTRPAALLAATLIVALYLLSLAATWEIIEREWRTWLTVFFTVLTGIPAIALMRMTTAPFAAIAGRVGLIIDAAVFLLLMGVAWSGWNWGGYHFHELAGWLALFGGMSIICLVGAGTGDGRFWRWIGIAACAIGYAIAAYATIMEITSTRAGERMMVYLICCAAAVAHANVVMLCPLRPGQRWLRMLTIAAGVAAALFVAISVTLERSNRLEYGLVDRLAGALGVIAGCGTLAIVVLARLSKRMLPPPTSMADVKPVQLTCPLCGKKQVLEVGRTQCGGCNVMIELRVEEPRCAVCNYSLLMLKSDRCPECGTPAPFIDQPAERRLAPS